MTKRTVYFIRHGESTDNRDGLVGGAESDSLLTEEGKQQAKDTARELQGIQFDLVVISPLSRVRQTADIIMRELNLALPVVVKQEFIEKYVGEFAGQPYPLYKAFKLTGGTSGESEIEMQDRVRSGLEWLKQQPFTNALVVSHSATIANVRTIIENLPLSQLASVPRLKNGEIYKIFADDIPPLK